ncbi:hypothetical protein DYD21_04100 [Rhodohalobacter sp. SW132]|uniref:hypothetical protein n=1 Tax=Rhodohalobacter sp. SW132 TaxID=2293433 RepID=UPI000E23D146|nr:hypothetical protein [Rhodohalobacter sp. SW132]REL39147.1 hypothetical protein DYD21_04100 [Rhodohalobacter sp. SW132]
MAYLIIDSVYGEFRKKEGESIDILKRSRRIELLSLKESGFICTGRQGGRLNGAEKLNGFTEIDSFLAS